MTEKLNSLDLVNRAINGRIFTVEFIKRTNDQHRVMTCRRGVKINLKGVGFKYDPFSRGLMPVYDVTKKAYRMVSLERLVALRFGGKTYRWERREFVEVR